MHHPLKSSTALSTLLALVVAACGASHLADGSDAGPGPVQTGADAAASSTPEGGPTLDAPPGSEGSVATDAGAYIRSPRSPTRAQA